MRENVFIADCAREDIGERLGVAASREFSPSGVEQALTRPVSAKSVRLGYWRPPGADPLPDFMIIPDDDQTDTLAWLSAFMGGLSPVTQWCRILTASDARRLSARQEASSERGSLTPWIGAVIAEFGAHLHQATHLKDVSAAAALAGPTFAAGRSVQVWGGQADLGEVVDRYDELSRRFREVPRIADTKANLPLWYTLSGDVDSSALPSEMKALAPFKNIFLHVGAGGSIDPDNLAEIAREVGEFFDLPEIEHCAIGPQSRRVFALDRVAKRLLEGPSAPSISALLGFSASLIDPGAAMLPELLRRYSTVLPLAPVWSGAFAGAWSPMRLLTDNNGLGRIISKEMSRPTDLFSKPSADIAFEELIRWVGQSGDWRSQIRGLSGRSLNVELVLGVTIPLPSNRELQRSDPPTTQSTTTSAQRALDLDERPRPRGGQDRTSDKRSDQPVSISNLAARLEALESTVAELISKTPRGNPRPARKG